MKHLILPVASLLLAAEASCAEPARELEPKAAAGLIALMNESREAPIAIVSIVEGSLVERGFESRHVRRVTAIHPVSEDGSMVRRQMCYDFRWNDSYGWFVMENRKGRGGDEAWIWSETEGLLVVVK